MSDDEEVIFEGSDLYNYLKDQGYCDFNTVLTGEYNIKVHVNDKNNDNQIPSPNHIQQLNVAFNHAMPFSDYNKLLNVVNSHLMFREDHEYIETILQSTSYIDKPTSSLFDFANVSCSILLLACITLNERSRSNFWYYIPFGISMICSAQSLWNYIIKFNESSENKLFSGHIKLLQDLCSNIHKVFRFIKETEIISTGQISSQKIGSMSYSCLPHSISFHHSNDLNQLPSWKTLPQLRSCLLEVLIRTMSILIETSVGLTNSVSSKLAENQIHLNMIQKDIAAGHCISFKDLQSLIDIYLSIQSEYLKHIALSLIPSLHLKSLAPDKKKLLFSRISQVKCELNDMSIILTTQYNIITSSSILKPFKFIKHRDSMCNKQMNRLRVEVHNISLVLLSVLLRIRSLEDFLEETGKNRFNDQHKFDISIPLNSMKQDLTYLVNYYETIYNQILPNGSSYIPSQINHTRNVSEENADKTYLHKTGVEVGITDFKVNSPDEVFLALSGMNNLDEEHFPQDWYFENKPQMPFNLFKELCDTLKTKKLEFNEREKRALERKGQVDIEDTSSTSESELEIDSHKRPHKHNTKYVKSLARESIEDGNVIHHITSKKKRSYLFSNNTNSAETTSDSNESSDSIKTTSDSMTKTQFDTLSLANLISIKSQEWKKIEEDTYSDS